MGYQESPVWTVLVVGNGAEMLMLGAEMLRICAMSDVLQRFVSNGKCELGRLVKLRSVFFPPELNHKYL